MGFHNNVLLGATIVVSFYLFHPPILSVNATSKTVTDFCNQRKSTDDRAFCRRVFKPKAISDQVKDTLILLKIALGLGVSHAKSTREFLTNLDSLNTTSTEFRPALRECISAYDDAIKDLQSINQELEDDPPMASYDAHMANYEFKRCDNALDAVKVLHDPISYRHKIAVDYSRLCEEIAEFI